MVSGAAEGIWYDAIENLSQQIEQQPQNQALHKARVTLVEQAGMPKVARHDQVAFIN